MKSNVNLWSKSLKSLAVLLVSLLVSALASAKSPDSEYAGKLGEIVKEIDREKNFSRLKGSYHLLEEYFGCEPVLNKFGAFECGENKTDPPSIGLQHIYIHQPMEYDNLEKYVFVPPQSVCLDMWEFRAALPENHVLSPPPLSDYNLSGQKPELTDFTTSRNFHFKGGRRHPFLLEAFEKVTKDKRCLIQISIQTYPGK